MKHTMTSRRVARHAPSTQEHGGPFRHAASVAIAGTVRLIGHDPFPAVVAAAGRSIQEPIATGRRVVVCSPEADTGTSTVASAMASAISTFRTDLLALIDIGDGPSGLHPAGGATPLAPQTALGALAVNEPATREEFRRTLRLQDADTVLDLHDDAPHAPLTAPAVRALIAGCTRHCATTITETPSGLEDERTLAALESAHAAVVVTDRAAHAAAGAASFVELLRHVHPRLPIVEVLNERRRTARSGRRQTPHGTFALRHARRLSPTHPPTFASLGEPMTMEILEVTARVMSAARGGRAQAAGSLEALR